MKTGVIIQARMSSTRLPGKVALELNGKRILDRVIEKCKEVEYPDLSVLVATSVDADDDVIEQIAVSQDIKCFRGSLNNVRQRFQDASSFYQFDRIIRVTSDNPLTSPKLIEQLIHYHDLYPIYDYLSHDFAAVPYGSGAELFTKAALLKSIQCSVDDYDLEHVTPYIRLNLKSQILEAPKDFICPGLRVTIDTDEDFKNVSSLLTKVETIKGSDDLLKIINLTKVKL